VKFVMFYVIFAPFIPFIIMLGLLYVGAWSVEAWGWVHRNPIDWLWEDYFGPWLDAIFELEYVKYPFLWLEYQVTILMGSFEFDYDDPSFMSFFYALVVPWIWLMVYIFLDPFLVGFMPVLLIIANLDVTFFAEEHQIWVEEKTDGIKEEAKMNSIESAFAGLTAGPEESLINTTIPRYRKTILVAKTGLSKLIARVYQL